MNRYSTPILCPLWETLAIKISREHPDSITVYSPRCGGSYSISNKVARNLETDDDYREKARLTSWLIEQRRLGNECPKITEGIIKLVKQRRDMSIPDRADAILGYIASKTKELGEALTYDKNDPIEEFQEFLFHAEAQLSFQELMSEWKINYHELIAFSECIDIGELTSLMEYLRRCGWIEYRNVLDNDGHYTCSLTVEGHARLAKIQQLKTESSRKFETSSRSIDQTQNINENDKIFISYSWDNEEHKQWVQGLARKLRGDGINATLDIWELAPGDQLTHFMEREIRESKYVLIICTPSYRKKSNQRQGGVGYEDHVMTAEMYQKENHRKFIPVFAKSCSWNDAAPSWLSGKLYVDLSTIENYERGYSELRATLLGERPTAPPVQRRSPNE